MVDYRIKGKNVLINGASKGIGRAIAEAYAREGARLTLVARSEALLTGLCDALRADGTDVDMLCADLMAESPKAVAQALIDRRGAFDIVIHNVGGSLTSRDPLGDMRQWGNALQFNAGIAIDMNSVLLPPMIEKGWGRVIHTSSMSAVSLRGNPLYAAAKAYLNAYVTSAGRELAKTGVVLSALMPGAIAFEGSYWDIKQKNGDFAVNDYLRHHQGIGRFGTVEEVAQVALFMGSEQASFMPGAIVPVDGAQM